MLIVNGAGKKERDGGLLSMLCFMGSLAFSWNSITISVRSIPNVGR